jgi:hypothetical protein
MKHVSPAQIEVRRALAGRSAKAFLEAHPLVSYRSLRDLLGTRLVPIRLIEGLGLECQRDGHLEWFARDLFVREIRESAPAGWKRGDFEMSVGLGAASAALRCVARSMDEHSDRAHNYLIGAIFIPDGWLPQTADDPFLVEAFDATREQDEPASEIDSDGREEPTAQGAESLKPRVESASTGARPTPVAAAGPQQTSSLLVSSHDLEGLSDEVLPRAAIERVMAEVEIHEDVATYRAGIERATPGQVAVFAVLWLDAEVRNGGFHQLFFNSTGIVARDAALGFRRIGASKCAEIVVRAMARFAGGLVPLDHDRRQAALERVAYDDWKEYFRPLEDAYYALQDGEENVAMLCSRYIRAHIDEFVRPTGGGSEAVRRGMPRRVLHPRFGAGTVVAEHDNDGGKLEIEFEDGVRRTLLSRFVTEV